MCYQITGYHGSGGGRKVGGKANRLQEMAQVVVADLYIMGHTHLPMSMKQQIWIPDYANNTLNKKESVSKLPDSRELTDVETQADDSNCGYVTDSESDINLGGHSSDELFNRPSSSYDDSKWVVCGYMKVGQVNLMVAGGGVGKTILMVQIALAVARGTRPEFLPDDCCASVKLSVIYYRLEDFSDELAGKYGKGKVLRDSGITWFLPEDLQELWVQLYALPFLVPS